MTGKRKSGETEHDHQAMVVRWFRLQYPKYHKHLFAIPNGAHLAGDVRVRAIKMHKLKEEGFLSGVHDLFLMVPRGGFHGLFIEMKKSKGTKRDDQVEFSERANDAGYRAEFCFGFDAAKELITQYMKGA